jgi:signal transduction histidine kinase
MVGALLFLAVLGGGLTARVLWVRRMVARETERQLVRSLDFTRPALALWRDGYVAQATLVARLPDPTAALGLLDTRQGIVGGWIHDASGRLVAGPLPAPPPPAPPPSDSAAVVRTRIDHGALYADVVARIGDGGRGTVLLRVRVTDTTFAAFNPARDENSGLRTALLVRVGDSVHVVATETSGRERSPARAFPLRDVPPYVRATLDGRPARGLGPGLFVPTVIYAATPLPSIGWVLVREQRLDVLFALVRPVLWIEESVFAALAILVAVVVVIGVRSARARRETTLAQLRADFVSAVSHELRTPLAQIRLFAELLRKKALRDEAEADRALGVIEKEAGRLAILVDNILSYTSLRRRTRFVTPLAADVAAEARQVIESFAPLAAERGAQVVADLETDTRARIDTQALRQVLLNFLENAVKYGPRGQTVTVGARHAGPRVRLWVDDEGPGVPAVERGAVWDAFYRTERAQRAGVGGSGLGLAVVRDLVAQYGGAVAVEDAPSGGARFVAELPGFPDR